MSKNKEFYKYFNKNNIFLGKEIPNEIDRLGKSILEFSNNFDRNDSEEIYILIQKCIKFIKLVIYSEYFKYNEKLILELIGRIISFCNKYSFYLE